MKAYVAISLLIIPNALLYGPINHGPAFEDRRSNERADIARRSSLGLNRAPGWHKLNGTMLKGGPENTSPCPANNFNNYGYPYAGNCGSVMVAWNSAVADLRRDRLILWGGGHTDYAGNEIYSLELSANPPTLVRLNPPSPPNSTSSCIETLADGRPNSRHTYDALVYLPNQDEMFVFGGSLDRCGFAGNAAWTLQLDSVLLSCAPNCSAKWTTQDLKSAPSAAYGITTAYDTAQNLVWLNDHNSLWSYDPAAKQFTKRGNVASCYHGTGVFDPDDRYFIQVDGCAPQLSYWSTTTGSSQKNPPLDASCAGLVNTNHNGNSGYPGLAWDPVEKTVVGYPNGGNTLYLLSPKTWTCKSETYGSEQGLDYPQDDAPTQGGGTFKHFNYFPDLDLFVLCNDPRNDCWYLRRRVAQAKEKKTSEETYAAGETTEQMISTLVRFSRDARIFNALYRSQYAQD
jgi:hypothetical protein